MIAERAQAKPTPDRVEVVADSKKMGPEVELLLCCTRVDIETLDVKRIEALTRRSLDWEYLLKMAYWHGVGPLLCQSLNALGGEVMPSIVASQLQNYVRAVAWHNLHLTSELRRVLGLFESAEIPTIPYKGPLLTKLVYGNLALRPFGDLDILIQKRDFLKAKDLLLAHGYRFKTPLASTGEETLLKSKSAFGFVHPDGKIIVDLHWGITYLKYFSFPLDTGRTWDDMEYMLLAGTEVRNLAPEALLPILCVHGSRHAWEKLKWVCDVSELLRAYPALDWNRVMAQARKFGHMRMLLLGLYLANTLLEASLPKKVREAIQAEPKVKSLAATARKWMLDEIDKQPSTTTEGDTFRLQLLEKFFDRIRYFLYLVHRYIVRYESAIGERDKDVLSLPPSLSFFYYFVRPIRLMKEYGLNLLKGVRGS